MDSDGDEDFVVSAPTKKTKKNKEADGEEKGKKKKGSATKGERVETSPKRKTPKGKKEKGEKEEKKGGKGKGKAKEKEKKASEDPEEGDFLGVGDGGDEDLGSFNPEDDKDDDFSAGGSDEEDKSAKKKKEKKAPKGKKEKGGGGAKGADEEEILEYMKKQNRPYSLINIYDNLHAKIKKAACQKALDNLVDNGELQAKEFGKAKLYLLNQSNIPQVSAKEMDKMKEGMNNVKQEHTKLTEEVKEMAQYLKNLSNQLTNEQLDQEIEKYQELIAEDKKKLEIYESGDYPKISDEDMKKAEEKKKKFETEFKKRKRICLDMLNSIADFMEQKLTNVMETVGIEVD